MIQKFIIYNHFHNILRLFDVLSNSPFTTSEMMHDYLLLINMAYTSCVTSYPNDLILRILPN